MRIHKLAFLLITLDFNKYIKVKNPITKTFNVLGYFQEGETPNIVTDKQGSRIQKKKINNILGTFS